MLLSNSMIFWSFNRVSDITQELISEGMNVFSVTGLLQQLYEAALIEEELP